VAVTITTAVFRAVRHYNSETDVSAKYFPLSSGSKSKRCKELAQTGGKISPARDVGDVLLRNVALPPNHTVLHPRTG
jgi:hypothetical protein